MFFSLVVALVLSTPAPPLPRLSNPPPLAPSPEARRSRAYQLYKEANDFRGASVEYERLWEELHDINDLVMAALSRLSAQHYAHAKRWTQELEGWRRQGYHPRPDLAAALAGSQTVLCTEVVAERPEGPTPGPPNPCAMSPERIEEWKQNRRLFKVWIEIAREHEGSGELIELRYIPHFASDERPLLRVELDTLRREPTSRRGTSRVALELDEGRWEVTVGSRGSDGRVERHGWYRRLRPGVREIQVGALAEGTPEVPVLQVYINRRRYAVRTGLAGLALGLGGAVGAWAADQRWRATRDRSIEECQAPRDPEFPIGDCRMALAGDGNLRALAAGFAGAGLGAGLGALVAASKRPWLRGAGFGLSVGLVGAGVIVAWVGAQRFDQLNEVQPFDALYREAAQQHAALHSGGAVLVGAGVGGLAAIGLGWLIHDNVRKKERSERKKERIAVEPQVGPRAALVSVRGRF